MKKTTIKLSLLLLLLAIHVIVFAQNKNVKGMVVNVGNNPLSGVSVTAKEITGLGTSTNTKGEFVLSIPVNVKTLIVSMVGYVKQEVAVANLNVPIVLVETASQLDELVVVGYGTQSKKDLTASISGVKAADIQNLPLPTIETALQGRASGVFINQGSGKLGQALNIRIRGISSISASSQPLFVIDGQPVIANRLGSSTEPDNPMASISPDDIETMDVLKDAAATAIYGARGANGVIIITTKSGKVGKTRINFDYYTGVSTPTHKRQFLNAEQYKQLFTEAAKNSSAFEQDFNGPDPGLLAWQDAGLDPNEWLNPARINWSDQAFQKGKINNYSLNFAGGDPKTKFFISGSYNDQKGIIIYNSLNRANLRTNLEHQVNDKFKLGVNLNMSRMMNYRVASDNAFTNPIQLNALPPLQPILNTDGTYNRNTLYLNVLNDVRAIKNNGLTYRTLGNFFAQYDLNPELFARTEIGGDLIHYEEEQYNGRNTTDGSPGGLGYSAFTRAQSLNTNNTLNWRPKLGVGHSLEILLGNSFQSSQTNSTFAEGKAFPNDQFAKLKSAAIISAGSSDQTGYSFLSFFTRANYKLMNRHVLGASLRYDGSSRFGVDKKFGWFPSVSGAWLISEEDFLKGNTVLSFLKLRASYGVTGNAEIGNFASRTLYTMLPYADQAGMVPSQVGLANLGWEKTNQFDVGINFGLFRDRITAEVDYFKKKTNGLLLDFPTPGINGFSMNTRNLGALYNEGFDISVTSNNLINDFKWITTFNISTYKNLITSLDGSVISGGNDQVGRISEGMPYGYFYGPKYAGVDPANGDALYYNAQGEKVNEAHYDGYEQVIGDPNPDFYGGLGNQFSYRNFDLNIQTQFVYGNDLFNVAGFYQSVNGNYFDNQTIDQMGYWTPTHTHTRIPQPRLYDKNGVRKSSRWVEDGSYLRLKNVVLGYNFTKSITSKLKMNTVRVYMSAQNLFTFTRYTGYDPEVNATFTGGVNLGHDFYTPPQAKTFTIGVNFGF